MSAVREVEGTGLMGAYWAEAGVARALMVRLKVFGVNPQGSGTGAGLWEERAVRAGPRESTGLCQGPRF